MDETTPPMPDSLRGILPQLSRSSETIAVAMAVTQKSVEKKKALPALSTPTGKSISNAINLDSTGSKEKVKAPSRWTARQEKSWRKASALACPSSLWSLLLLGAKRVEFED